MLLKSRILEKVAAWAKRRSKTCHCLQILVVLPAKSILRRSTCWAAKATF